MVHSDPEKRRKYLQDYRNRNREKIRAQTREQSRLWKQKNPEVEKRWNSLNPEKCRVRSRRSSLKKIGWTIETFEHAFKAQNGKCWICSEILTREPKKSNTAHADHNHVSGKARGILCATCNLAEGAINKIGLDPIIFSQNLKKYYTRFDEE